MRAIVWGLGALGALALLAGCGNPAATPEREETAAAPSEGRSGDVPSSTRRDGEAGGDRGDERSNRRERADSAERLGGGGDAPALAETHRDGSPMRASNRRRTAAEAAQRQFERNGAAFGAATRAAYIDRAHAFVSDPPERTQTAERRNGDRLMYDPRGNVFAVATREGAPRTMFKPEDGAAYWRAQQESVANGARRQAERRSADE